MDLLTTALGVIQAETDRDHVDEFLAAHTALESARERTDPGSPPDRLALEVAYDAALIRLSDHLGIETGPERFDPPASERERLHREVLQSLPNLTEVLLPVPPLSED